MKYPTQAPATAGSLNQGHVVIGILPGAPVGTVRAQVWKLMPGGAPAQLIALSAPFDLCVATAGQNRFWTFDVKHAIDQGGGAPGNFDALFPHWEEHALLVKVYDSADASTNFDVAKLVFGGGEDQIDGITGSAHRNLTEIFDSITGGGVVAACLLSFKYVDTGVRATDELYFYPFLLLNGQQVADRFLRTARVDIYDVNGVNPLFTVADGSVETTITASIGDAQTVIPVLTTAGFNAGDVLAIDDELVTVNGTPPGPTTLNVIRSPTTAAAHSNGAAIWKSGADPRGVFECIRTDTNILVYGQNYTAKVTVGYKQLQYVSTHQFLFLQNSV